MVKLLRKRRSTWEDTIKTDLNFSDEDVDYFDDLSVNLLWTR
jgi:hypothetical protein